MKNNSSHPLMAFVYSVCTESLRICVLTRAHTEWFLWVAGSFHPRRAQTGVECTLLWAVLKGFQF